MRQAPSLYFSTLMCLPGSIFVPHHGQFVSWWGDPTPPTAPDLGLPPCAALTASSASLVQLGVVLPPTHRPMRNGVLPQRLSPLLMAVRRMSSQAQIRAAARWNCWSVSSRSVYRISTVTPFSPERPSTVPCSRRRPSV